MSACVAFGPNDSHFFNSPNQWSMSGLPADLNALFNGQSKIKEVHEVALGPEGSYAVTYSHHAGMSLVRSGLPLALEKWLVPGPSNAVARDIPSLQIALGPGSAYFAYDKNGAAWSSLPKPMNDALEARRDVQGRVKGPQGPASVSLGPDGAYVFITTGGGGFWNLQGQNDVLEHFLQDRQSLYGVSVILDPCRPGIYIAFLPTGECAGSVLTSQFPQYQALAADWRLTCQTAASHPAPQPAPLHSLQAPRTASFHPAPHPIQHPAYRPVASPHQPHSSNVAAGKDLVEGLILFNSFMEVQNGNSSGGSGQVHDSTDYSSSTDLVDTSNLWQFDQSAASDLI